MYYSFGTEFEQNLYKFPAPWQEADCQQHLNLHVFHIDDDGQSARSPGSTKCPQWANKQRMGWRATSIHHVFHLRISCCSFGRSCRRKSPTTPWAHGNKEVATPLHFTPEDPEVHDNTASTTMKLITASIGTSSVPFPSSLATSLRTFSGSAGSDSSSWCETLLQLGTSSTETGVDLLWKLCYFCLCK